MIQQNVTVKVAQAWKLFRAQRTPNCVFQAALLLSQGPPEIVIVLKLRRFPKYHQFQMEPHRNFAIKLLSTSTMIRKNRWCAGFGGLGHHWLVNLTRRISHFWISFATCSIWCWWSYWIVLIPFTLAQFNPSCLATRGAGNPFRAVLSRYRLTNK